MHDYSLDPFNLQTISNSLIVSQLMETEASVWSINVMKKVLVNFTITMGQTSLLARQYDLPPNFLKYFLCLRSSIGTDSRTER